ncbi:SusC/RagA family TonB-linked outer membrane protein [Tannerella forsythia]|uniref:TonB-dependent receptor n=1 Tax=Tannerella forsythia TaxID=28112 RepID=A0A3P1YIG9_TANFO|nr:TonB-dependent receptor [Tannerella forsythia]RRD69930.1 TonB-dependent receptor [Tannerella forsythia]
MKQKIIMLMTFLLIGAGSLMAQTQVQGTVVDEQGEPVIEASIVLKTDRTKGTISDIDGKFTLSVPNGSTLVFSFVGFKTQEAVAQPNMKITMMGDTETLDEVIVVAYGTAKKSSFTGSATSVGSQRLEMRPISNVSQAITGAAPGVQTTLGSGQPGSSLDIRIRGFGSVNASNKPLYIVDGSPYTGDISDLNPADIENLTILKDAASTSLYGSSAGNGVVLITTKKGKGQSRKPIVRVTSSWGTSMRGIPEYERVGIMDYYPMMWKQLYNSYIYADKPLSEAAAAAQASKAVFEELKYNPFKGVKGEEIVGADGKLNPSATSLLYGDDTDWEKAITRSANRSEYGISLSQQGEKSDSYASLNYLKDNGYVFKTMFERFSGRVNANYKATEWLKGGVNISAFRTKSTYSRGDETGYVNPFFFSRFIGPIYPVYLHDETTGEYILDANGEKIYDYEKPRGKDAFSGRHILAETDYNFEQITRDGINSRMYATVNILPELEFTVNLSYDNTNSHTTEYKNREVGDSKDKGSLEKENTRSTTVNLNQLLNYKKTFSDVHNFDILLGHENYLSDYESLTSRKGKQILDNVYEYGNFITPEVLSSYTRTYRKEGYFTRVNYDYNNKYYGSLSFRRDGTSRFHKDKRWGNFWSVGGSWRIGQEEFMKNLTWIDDLKIRASYGQTGVDDVLDEDGYSIYYAYQTLYGIGWNNFENPGILFSKLGNNTLLWETQISSDVALEFSFLERIRGSIEYFNKESKDLLFSLPLPLSSGTTSIDDNIGKVRNQGIEMDLNVDIIKNKELKWSIGFNITHFTNKILQLPPSRKEIISGTKKLMEGRSIYDFWLRQYKGVDSADGMPLYQFDNDPGKEYVFDAKDCRVINGDSLTTNFQKAKYDYSGSVIPKVYGGFNTTVSYRGFEFATYFAYQLGGKSYDGAYGSLMEMDNMGGALHVDAMKDSWQKPGDVTNVPRLDAGQSSTIGAASTRWLTSSNALVIKSISLGYTLPKSLTNKVFIENAKVTFAGENLFLFAKRKGLNPMRSYTGTTANVYSAARSFNVGLQLTF